MLNLPSNFQGFFINYGDADVIPPALIDFRAVTPTT